MAIDLTPFGFTPTESAVYGTLLELGPSGGYGVAKALGIARANGYQALDGLVEKGAADLVEDRPKKYRAIRPQALFAKLADRQSALLDRLEEQIEASPADGVNVVAPVRNLRALRELVTRTVVRAGGRVRVIASADFLESVAPALRARGQANKDLAVWSTDREPTIPVSAPVLDGVPPLLLLDAGSEVLAASLDEDPPSGHWTSAPALVAAVQTAIEAYTR